MSWLKSLYGNILSHCGSPKAPYILGLLSFTESCIFIIPPELLMLPMTYANRKKAWAYAAITTITSVLGAIAGYYLGMHLWEFIQTPLFNYISGFESHFNEVGVLYEENAFEALFLAAFTPIPFKVFTVAAGVYSTKVSLMTLVGTSLLGRGVRYFLMVGLVYFLGERAKVVIEKHFAKATLILGGLAVLVIYFLKIK